VTFKVDRSAPPPRPHGTVIDGIAELPPEPVRPESDQANKGEPVKVEFLLHLLSFIDPSCNRKEWCAIIAGIRATNLIDRPEEFGAVEGPVEDGTHLELCQKWSRGEFWKDGKPSNFVDDDDVEAAFDSMPPDPSDPDKATFGKIIFAAELGGWQKREKETKDRGEPFLLTVDDLFAWKEPAALVSGFLMQGENVTMYSPPKSGKTFIALDIALSIATGVPVFGKRTVMRPGEAVVYLSGEGHAGMQKRIKAWLIHRKLEKDVLKGKFFYKAGVPETAAGIDEANRYIAGISLFCRPALVVIDTMARSVGKLNENDSSTAAQYLELTERIRSGLDTTMLTLAHTGKNASLGLRGSSAFGGGFDAVWELEANKERKTGKLEATLLKDSDELPAICFRLVPITVSSAFGKSDITSAAVNWMELREYEPPPKKGHKAKQPINVASLEDHLVNTLRGRTDDMVSKDVAKRIAELDLDYEGRGEKAASNWLSDVANDPAHPCHKYCRRVGARRSTVLWRYVETIH
jgi:hypothetical protein